MSTQVHRNPHVQVNTNIATAVRDSMRNSDSEEALVEVAKNVNARSATTHATTDHARRASARTFRPNHVFSRVSNVNRDERLKAARRRAAPTEEKLLQHEPVVDRPSAHMLWLGAVIVGLIVACGVVILCVRSTGGNQSLKSDNITVSGVPAVQVL